MSNTLIKNVNHSEIFKLSDLVQCEKGKTASITLTQQNGVGVSVLAMCAGEGLGTHSAPGDALISVLEGEGEFTINEKPFVLKAGESIVMSANAPHSVKGVTDFKFLITIIK